MDGREAMSFPSHYYLPRGAFTNLSPSQVASGLHAPPPGMRPMPSPNVHHPQANNPGPHFPMADHRHSDFGHSIHMGMASSAAVQPPPLPQQPPPPPMEQPLVKKKRGRPRKYAPDGRVSLGLSPVPCSSAGSNKAKDSSAMTDPNAPKRARGRPPGTGRKQRLANLGGSYLVNEEGGSKSRTGGLSVSLSGPEGHVIGGGIGMLIAASLVQVVACSFVYGGVPKSNNNNNKTIKQEGEPKEEHNDSEMETTPTNPEAAAEQVAQQTPQNFSGQGMSGWPGSGEGSVSGSGRSLDSSRNLLTDIDLTRG
ncbi:hypothetical protein HID58_032741 [Brassica napus]|uniref:AT-hook motif nuclear-localized protein n=1 Tax=Brassica napus TaxID=3708 RepID=A0ABQ8BX79_BRANA|nr:hypothetical protein HID58_032741 [Brassica napus]